jgi:hypothetical protein
MLLFSPPRLRMSLLREELHQNPAWHTYSGHIRPSYWQPRALEPTSRRCEGRTTTATITTTSQERDIEYQSRLPRALQPQKTEAVIITNDFLVVLARPGSTKGGTANMQD